MIIAEGIVKYFSNLQVLKGINLSVKEGEIVSIVGASGAGKSTLLHILGTLDSADQGRVLISGEDISRMNSRRLADFRNRKIGFVFQQHHLLPEFSALENVCIPALIARRTKAEAEQKALELLQMLNLADRSSHRPSELSGGEQQRVAVARALINSPAVVLADEPSGNLDSTAAHGLHTLFFDLRKKLNQTFVIVTHNTQLADMADRKLTMNDGVFA